MPNSDAPTKMHISVTSGCRPICWPTTCGSSDWRTTVMMPYKIKMPMPCGTLPRIRATTPHGMSTVPVPSTGRMSTTAMNSESSSAYSTRSSVRPISSSTKVRIIKSRYARRNLNSTSTAVFFTRNSISRPRSGRQPAMKLAMEA